MQEMPIKDLKKDKKEEDWSVLFTNACTSGVFTKILT